jgi:hypothetical protein
VTVRSPCTEGTDVCRSLIVQGVWLKRTGVPEFNRADKETFARAWSDTAVATAWLPVRLVGRWQTDAWRDRLGRFFCGQQSSGYRER